MCQLPQVTSTWCTNRFESPWAVCCQNGGVPSGLTGQAEACGKMRRLTTPARFRRLSVACWWRIPERVQTVKRFLLDFSSPFALVQDIRSTPKPVASF